MWRTSSAHWNLHSSFMELLSRYTMRGLTSICNAAILPRLLQHSANESLAVCIFLGEDYQDEYTGFQYEHLGDLYNDNNESNNALNAYRKAVQAFQISRGGSDDPYTRCATKKLISVDLTLLSLSSSVKCGLCNLEATKKCTRCGVAVYCNKDHQAVHWKVHKKVCHKHNC